MADVTITAANCIASSSATIRQGTAGATITAGDACYLDSATDTYKLAIATTLATSKARGIALNSCSTGQPVDICESDNTFTPGGTVAVGKIYVVSPNNAGGICLSSDAGVTTGTFTTVLGVGLSTTQIRLNCGSHLRHCAQVAMA